MAALVGSGMMLAALISFMGVNLPVPWSPGLGEDVQPFHIFIFGFLIPKVVFCPFWCEGVVSVKQISRPSQSAWLRLGFLSCVREHPCEEAADCTGDSVLMRDGVRSAFPPSCNADLDVNTYVGQQRLKQKPQTAMKAHNGNKAVCKLNQNNFRINSRHKERKKLQARHTYRNTASATAIPHFRTNLPTTKQNWAM